MSTSSLSAKQIQRSWHLVDAKEKVLGRLATDVAKLLMGKNKSSFVPYLDTGDNVVVVNASTVKVTGKKEGQKIYFRHSGYPKGDRRELLSDLRKRKPEDIIFSAVKGMLPKTKLGRVMIKKLHVFSGSKHPYENKLKTENLNVKSK